MTSLARNALPYLTSPSGYAAAPLTIYWSVNSVCNLRCKMCDVGQQVAESNFYKNLRLDGSRGEIGLDVFQRVVDEVAPHRPMMSITATEPLIYRPLPQAIEYAVNRGLEVAVTTGGYNLATRAPELIEAGLRSLNVSLDGPPALHNEIRGRKDSFERACEGIQRMKDLAAHRPGPPLRVLVNCVITNHNFHALTALMDAVRDVPIDQLNFTFMSYVTENVAEAHNVQWGSKYHATVNCLAGGTDPTSVDLPVLREQLAEVRRRSKGEVNILPNLDASQLETYFQEPSKFISKSRCMVSWFIAQIIANGDVIPYTRCYNVPLGNVNETPFMDIWNGESMRHWRQELREHKRFPACTRCDQCM